jgi:DNA (cytosine-5)-methyltransferase 1
MIYGSVCSGIEAATAAWHPLGWEPAFFSEIEKFPRAVLQHHYPAVPLHGDFTTIGADEYGSIDLLVGGTPCQSFSIAGLRKGMDDDRGNLALEFLRLAQRKRPTWVVWENVPGVLSSNGGRDFGAFLGGLGELGYGYGYRTLDAQYFGVPQRRRRVFVVGYLGDWRPAAAVLFERHCLQGHSAPSRETGQTAPTIPARSTAGGGLGTDFDCDGGLIKWPADVASTMNAHFGSKMGLEDQHALGGASYFVPETMGTLTTRMMTSLGSRDVEDGAVIPTLAIRTANTSANGHGVSDVSNALRESQGGRHDGMLHRMAVRRLTPRECERLQGFPDDFTCIPWRGKDVQQCPDGPRYKALGNSMAVPVMAWLGERIQMVDELISTTPIAERIEE